MKTQMSLTSSSLELLQLKILSPLGQLETVGYQSCLYASATLFHRHALGKKNSYTIGIYELSSLTKRVTLDIH